MAVAESDQPEESLIGAWQVACADLQAQDFESFLRPQRRLFHLQQAKPKPEGFQIWPPETLRAQTLLPQAAAAVSRNV